MKINLLYFFSILITSVFFVGCHKEDDTTKLNDYNTGYYWISNYSDSWSDVFSGLNGNSILCKKAEGGQHYSAIVASISQTTNTIILNEAGLPKSLSIDKYDLIFNYTINNTISIAIVDPSGFNSSIRNLKSDIDFTNINKSLKLKSVAITALWQDLSYISSVLKMVSDELISKIPGIGNNLNTIIKIIETVNFLKETDGYNARQMAEYLENTDIAILLKRAEELFELKSKSADIDKAIRLLAFDIKTESFSEVTNKSALCDAQLFLVNLPGRSESSFNYIFGIHYCEESGNPTNNGIGVSKMLYYDSNSTGSTNYYSFRLTGLIPQKKYKYCAFIQCDDFIDYGEINTLETIYVNIDSWEQTGSEKVENGESYYIFKFNQYITLSGNLNYIKEVGVFSGHSNIYFPLMPYYSGNNSMWFNLPTDQSSLSVLYYPYVLFKNGEYYKGASVTRFLNYGTKSTNIINRSDKNIGFGETSGGLNK